MAPAISCPAATSLNILKFLKSFGEAYFAKLLNWLRAGCNQIFTLHLHTRMILAPLRLSSLAVSSPRPEVPPVMMTVLPTRLVIIMMMMRAVL